MCLVISKDSSREGVSKFTQYDMQTSYKYYYTLLNKVMGIYFLVFAISQWVSKCTQYDMQTSYKYHYTLLNKLRGIYFLVFAISHCVSPILVPYTASCIGWSHHTTATFSCANLENFSRGLGGGGLTVIWVCQGGSKAYFW